MSDDKKQVATFSNWVIARFLFIFGLIIGCAVLGIQNYHFRDTINRQSESIATLNKDLADSIVENTKKIETISNMELEKLQLEERLETMRNRLIDIKNGDDLLKRDIFLYIDNKFSRVPDSVSKEIADEILTISKKENISPELIMGIMQVESSFNPLAISNKGARGLMQVMPAWAKKFELEKVSDLHNIDTNIECGVRVLKIHIEESKGSLTKGLYHYVGKSDSYAGKVYQAMGQFIAFRSNVPDDDSDETPNAEENDPITEGN